MKYTDQNYWNNYWDNENRDNYNFYFSELLDKYIAWDRVGSYMEIGGAPGSILAYMRNEHGLKVATVDFTDRNRIISHLHSFGVDDALVICEDFAYFDSDKYKKQFDIVASWGFVEHFEKDITDQFISKKKNMVADDGYLIVELPNIRKLIWLGYWLFNRKLIGIHNLKVMDLEWIRNKVVEDGTFEVLYASYYFAMNEQNEFFIMHPSICTLCKKIVDLFKNGKVKNSIRRWFYPYIVVIAKKRTSNDIEKHDAFKKEVG